MLKTKIIRAETKVVDAAVGRIHAIVSTETRDRDGDIIRQEGWDTGHFLSHPVLLASHNYYRLRAQIGEWESMEIKGKRLEGIARYYVGEGNEEADWAFNLASKGRAAYSVGFIPDWSKIKELKDGGLEFNGQELLEVSHVSVPSNPQALQQMKGLHPEIEALVAEMMEQEAQTTTSNGGATVLLIPAGASTITLTSPPVVEMSPATEEPKVTPDYGQILDDSFKQAIRELIHGGIA